jgi:uncharacterized membrane protein YqjE
MADPPSARRLEALQKTTETVIAMLQSEVRLLRDQLAEAEAHVTALTARNVELESALAYCQGHHR